MSNTRYIYIATIAAAEHTVRQYQTYLEKAEQSVCRAEDALKAYDASQVRPCTQKIDIDWYSDNLDGDGRRCDLPLHHEQKHHVSLYLFKNQVSLEW